MDVVAEYRLHLKYPDGETVQVWLRVGRPVRMPTGNWECAGELDGGRWTHPSHGPFVAPVVGGTSWQALVFAIRFLYQVLRAEVGGTRGAVMYDESGKGPIHLDELFPLLRDWQSPPPS